MKAVQTIKKNKLPFVVGCIYLLLLLFATDKAVLAVKNSMYYIKEMLQIMPVVFILTSLIEAWVPKKVIMNAFGEKSGIRGTVLSLALGSLSAGPIYAAFPVCKTLLRKGATISNIVIILSSWAVIKLPMLANEAKFLGIRFMGIRWVLTTIAIMIMAYIISLLVKKETIPDLEEEIVDKNGIEIKEEYCIGCGLCSKICPEVFLLEAGKAKVLETEVKQEFLSRLEKLVEKCPAQSIGWRAIKVQNKDDLFSEQ